MRWICIISLGITLTLSLSSCFQLPVKSEGHVSVLDIAPRVVSATQTTESKVSSKIDPNIKSPQQLQAPVSSNLKGSSVVLQPGTLTMAADLIVEEAVPLNQTSLVRELGVTESISVQNISAGLIIRPTEGLILTQPMTISMPIPLGSSLALQASRNFTVFYKQYVGSQLQSGVIPSHQIVVNTDGTVSFLGYFGVYWVAVVSQPVAAEVKIVSVEPIVNVRNVPVIESTGIVKEASIMAKEIIPEVSWEVVALNVNSDSRKVTLTANVKVGRQVSACKADFYSSINASSGTVVETGRILNASHEPSRTTSHSLLGRFRCIDDQGRFATSPWSTAVVVPEVAAATVDLGPDLVVRTKTLLRPIVSGGVKYVWSMESGPGAVNFSAADASSTEVSATLDGVYILKLTVTGKSGVSVSDDLQLTWDTTPPTVNVGPDIIANGTRLIDATVNGAIKYQWSMISGPGIVSFSNPNSEDTSFFASLDGNYILRLTAVDLAGNSAFGQLQMTWKTIGPTVFAGPDRTTNSIISLNASSSDASTFNWSKVSGPGTLTFGSPSLKDTTVAASIDGSYVIRLTVQDIAGNSASDDLVLNWDTVAPLVNVGADLTAKNLITLNATTSGASSFSWAKISGPGLVGFGSPTQENTTVSATVDGNYWIRLTATDAAGNSGFDELILTWDTTPPTVTLPGSITANSSVWIDASTSDAVSFNWSKVSGPGTIIFSSPTQEDTSVQASMDGMYIIRLTASDAIGNSAYADLTLNWDGPPIVNAGSDITTGQDVNLSASVIDGTSYLWELVSGPGLVTFSTPNATNTIFRADTDGTYIVRFKAYDAGGQQASDELQITWQRSFKMVYSMRWHSCAIMSDDSVKCWGENSSGQLGYGDTVTRNKPPLKSLSINQKVQQLSLGYAMTCALLFDNSVRCWGQGGYGALGTGNYTQLNSPPSTSINLGSGARFIASGNYYNCAVLLDDSVKCWGMNSNGQLGYGDTTTRNSPAATAISLGMGAVSLAAASDSSCALLVDGTVKCWGRNPFGQLGYGDTTDRSSPPGTVVNLGMAAKSLIMSSRHTCAQLVDDSLKCWGDNYYGTLGYGDTTSRTSPATTSVPLPGPVRSLAAGLDHTCALLMDNTVRCWGNNQKGELGVGDLTVRTSPPASALNLGQAAIAVAAGYSYSCALLSDFSLKCWGANEVGQLGYGDVSNRSYPGVNPINTGASSLSSSVGKEFACSILSDNTVKCWGRNFLGQLGYGDTTLRSSPAASSIALSPPAKKIDLGESHSCVIRLDDSLVCWGANGSGQLGYNDSTQRSAPPTASVNLGQGVKDVSSGSAHTCVILLDNSVRCWGHNNTGKLGYGDTTQRSAPIATAVNLGLGAKVVSLGDNYSCALLMDDTIRCWGDNYFGQLGYGHTSNILAPPGTPVDIGVGRTAKGLFTGDRHACAILDDDSVKCWGYNSYGNLGYGDSTQRTQPAASSIVLGQGAKSLALGLAHTCALLFDDNVKCWGSNSVGQLGFAAGTSITSPSTTTLNFGQPVKELSARADNTCAVLFDDSLRCWGDNIRGQLGDGYPVRLVPPANAVPPF